MFWKKKASERSERSQAELSFSEIEKLLYEVAYRREMLYDKGCDATEDSYAIIVPIVLATLLRRTQILLSLAGFIIGLLLGNLISRTFF